MYTSSVPCSRSAFALSGFNVVEMCTRNTPQAAKQMSEVCAQGILGTQLKSFEISFVFQTIGEGHTEMRDS